MRQECAQYLWELRYPGATAESPWNRAIENWGHSTWEQRYPMTPGREHRDRQASMKQGECKRKQGQLILRKTHSIRVQTEMKPV